ncbi:hypothetical protein QAD02_010000 [Eretmocerus hayati]|uniref:Uncharacterized protein n=1 Tax=Eretmocerus hayati TaxID=131215 RepID=A0ACC2NDB9_9HYME|nr:hypothetical protein QAD02_010000 [Eretmocerus hayati]
MGDLRLCIIFASIITFTFAGTRSLWETYPTRMKIREERAIPVFKQLVRKESKDGKLLMKLGEREEGDFVLNSGKINLQPNTTHTVVVYGSPFHKLTQVLVKYPKKFEGDILQLYMAGGLEELDIIIKPEIDAPKNSEVEIQAFGKPT